MSDTTVREDGHADDRERVSPWFADSGEDSVPPQGIEPAASTAVGVADQPAGEAAAAVEAHPATGAAGTVVDDHAEHGFAQSVDGVEPGVDAEYDDYGDEYAVDYADWDEYGEYDEEYETGADELVRRGNGLGVAALVLGLVGLFPLGLLLGVFALFRRGRRKFAAVVAVLIALAWSVGVVLFWGQLVDAVPRVRAYGVQALSLVRGGAEAVRNNGGQAGNAFGDGVFALHVGDCFVATPGQDGKPQTHAVACDLPHAGQVFAQFALPDGKYPDQDSIETAAMSTCHDRSNQVLDRHRVTPAMQLLAAFPQRLALAAGHRTVSCVVNEPGAMLTSSMMAP